MLVVGGVYLNWLVALYTPYIRRAIVVRVSVEVMWLLHKRKEWRWAYCCCGK